MKVLDIIHQSGTFTVESKNKIISVNIVDIHPELILENNLIIVFENDLSYYRFVSNSDIYSIQDNEVNVDELLKYDKVEDETDEFSYNGTNINNIIKINHQNDNIYLLNGYKTV